MKVQLPNVSGHSQSSQREEESVRQIDNPALPLAQNRQESQSKCPSPSTIGQALFLIFMLGVVVWMGSWFLSEEFIRSQKPQSLARNNDAKEIVSPDETDFRAYYYYKKMLAQAIESAKGNKPQNQTKPFENITFHELYDVFKVVKTIQLAKDYSTSAQQHKQIYEGPKDVDLNTPVNYTSLFEPVVDQFRCASCYSFPVTATIQYLYKKKLNISIKFSEQQLIDCAKDDPEANGCNDGNITKTFQYVRDTGLVADDVYPYRSINGKSFECNKDLINQTKKYKISGFKILPYRSCEAIQEELVRGNVVASMINTGQLSNYVKGPFHDCTKSDFNHAVTIVGQTKQNDWIIRNSWGQNWGMNGYFTLARGNTCGICSYGIVPLLQLDEKGEVKKIEDEGKKDEP